MSAIPSHKNEPTRITESSFVGGSVVLDVLIMSVIMDNYTTESLHCGKSAPSG